MTKIIGLTGGIGSGKTTVANLFLQNGIPVYIADDESKKLLDTIEISEAIKSTFGQSIINGGKIDRAKLAAIVFENPEKLSALNSILHPAVKTHFLNWVASHENETFVVKETAILFESGNDKDCDAIITVTAPLELKIERVLKRDSTTRENVLKRMVNQWPDEKKIANSNFVIQNTSLRETEDQFSKILKNLQNI